VLPMARWLCESELVSLMAPVRPGAPGWLSPAVPDGMAFFSATPWLPEITKIIATFGHLYVSSANTTGEQSATTAAQVGRSFGDDLLVLDGDARRDRSRPHGSTTIIRLTEAGDLAVARPGINNAAFGTDLNAYASDLSRRWQARRQQAA
jgi:L-threonylcarbamoyladenylate synthase